MGLLSVWAFFYKPKWQISVHFDILQLVRSLPFHRPEARKSYPSPAKPPCIYEVIIEITVYPTAPPPPSHPHPSLGLAIWLQQFVLKVPNKDTRFIEPRIQSNSSILLTCWGNRHKALNWGTAGLLGKSWVCHLFTIGLRRFSWRRGINLFVNNTDYIKLSEER